MLKPELKPGMPLNIVFANELNRPNAKYMKAVLYDYAAKDVTMSQTSPALSPSFINRRIFITFLVKIDNRFLRFGFPAKLTGLDGNYALSEGNTVEALIARKAADPEPTDFRLYFRVKPPANSDLCVFMEEQKVNLLDISIGGALFIYSKQRLFHPGEDIEFKLLIRTNVFNVSATVRNVRYPETTAAGKKLQYVGVEFYHDNKDMETALSRAILDIERSLLSKGKI